jgi:hypothetical protein
MAQSHLIVVKTLVVLLVLNSSLTSGAANRTSLLPISSYLRSNQVASQETEPEPQPEPQRIDLGPGPLKPGKVIVEYITGSLFSVFTGVIIAAIGSGITRHSHPGYEEDWDFSGLAGAAYGYLIGSAVGSTFGVCIAGNSGGEHGSTWGTLAGSLLGTAGGLVAGAAVADSHSINSLGTVFITYTLTQTTGSVLGFNLTRKRVEHKPLSP